MENPFWITYFPMSERNFVGYGPFTSFAEAEDHARTLSTDPGEGVVMRIDEPVLAEGDRQRRG